MKSALIIDQGEVGLALALRAAQAGWKVFYWIEDRPENNAKETGKDLHKNIIKVKDWLPHVTQVDLVVAMENGSFMKKLDFFRKRGAPIYCASYKASQLEIDRGYGMKWLEDRGVKVPSYETFKTLDEVEKYVRDNPERYVIKPAGDCPNKALSFVAKSPGQLLQQIQQWKEQKADFCGDIIVQEFIQGIEFGVSSWIGKYGFIGYPCENFEHKKCYPGEVGVGTGEQGTIAKYVKESKLFDELLKPLEDDLVELEAFTDVDLNCIIAEDGTPYVLEFTMRPGIPIFNMQLFAHHGDPLQWMLDALSGDDTLKVDFDLQIGVVLSVPDYPFNSEEWKEKGENLPVYGITKTVERHFQPQGIKQGKFLDEDGEPTEGYMSTGNYVACVVAQAPTIKEAREKVYGVIDEIDLAGMQYRNDIGEKVIKALPELQDMGYASDWRGSINTNS